MLFTLELEASKKQAEADKKAIDDLVRERDILNKVWQCDIVFLVTCFKLFFFHYIIFLTDLTCFCFLQNLLKAAGATQKQLGLVRLHEQTKKNLEQEIQVSIINLKLSQNLSKYG